jgi:hypothetical protein
MTDPRKSLNSSSPRFGRRIVAGVALSVGLLAGLAPASAAWPLSEGYGSAAPLVAPASYKARKLKRLYLMDSYGAPSYPSYPRSSAGMPFGGSDEILELQRRFPQTLWPPSMRYFPPQ